MSNEDWFTEMMSKAVLPMSKNQIKKLGWKIKIHGAILKDFDAKQMLREKNPQNLPLDKKTVQKMVDEYFAEVENHPPFKKPARGPKFSDLPGWGSGSKVQTSYFLTLRVYFNWTSANELWDSESELGKLLAITKHVKKKSVNKLAKFADWNAYLRDIEKYRSEDSPSRNIYLGVFSMIRIAQLLGVLPQAGGDRPHTRSQTKAQESGKGNKREAERPSTRDKHKQRKITSPTKSKDAESSSPLVPAASSACAETVDLSKRAEMFAKLRLNDKYREFGSNVPAHVKEASDETEKSTGASAIFKGLEVRSPTTAKSLELPKPEDPVTASFVELLQAVCMAISTPLQWTSSKPSFTMTRGKARITSVADGRLSQILDSESFPYAILEVKPYLLRSDNFGAILRQVGLEMVTWIYHCNEDCKGCGKPRKDCKNSHKACKVARKPLPRYVMPCQFGVEAWVFVAECSPDYLQFLKSGGAEKPHACLPIYLCGPFDIYDPGDMLAFGLGIFALTLQTTKDEFPDDRKVK